MAKIECYLSCKQKLSGVFKGGSEHEFLCFPSAYLGSIWQKEKRKLVNSPQGHFWPVLRVRDSVGLHSGTAWTS